MTPQATPDRIDAARTALIVYDACRRALTPADPARRAAMRPVLDAWVTLIGACRARAMPIIYTTPVSRADGSDVVLLPTDLSVETGVREAFSMDFDTVVVRDCCWSGAAAAHAFSLDTSMKMYARVRTLEQTLAMLR